MTSRGSADNAAGRVFAGYLSEVLQTEWHRRNSIEQRAGVVIATSGGLNSFLLAMVLAFQSGYHGGQVPPYVKVLLGTATIVFVVAALIGLVALAVAVPRSYRHIGIADAYHMVGRLWDIPEERALWKVAMTQAEILHGTRLINNWRARVLQAAVIFEGVGILIVTASILVLLTGH